MKFRQTAIPVRDHLGIDINGLQCFTQASGVIPDATLSRSTWANDQGYFHFEIPFFGFVRKGEREPESHAGIISRIGSARPNPIDIPRRRSSMPSPIFPSDSSVTEQYQRCEDVVL